MLRAYPKFEGTPITITPEGNFKLGDVVSTIRPASEMVPDFTQQATWDSLNAEVRANAKAKTYTAQGAQHPVPTSAAAYAMLPALHQQAIQKKFVQAGIYHPATNTISINAEWAHDPDVWAEEYFHAGVARLTPEERAAGLTVNGKHYPLKDKAQEERAYRDGLRIHPDVYARSRIPGTLGSEGIHGQEEAVADTGAARDVQRHDAAVHEAGGPSPDTARGRAGEGPSYATRGEAPSRAREEEVTGEPVFRPISELLADAMEPDGGFTYSPTKGSPTSGYAVSVTKNAERILNPRDLSVDTLYDYADQFADHLDNPRNYIGGWHNPRDGKIYLDISTVVKTPEEAERLGTANQQLAYFDLKNGKSVLTNYGEARRVEDLQSQAAPSVLRGRPPTLTHEPSPSYGMRVAPEERQRYAPVEKAASLNSMMAHAHKGEFDRRRDFKIFMEDLVRRAAADAGVNLRLATDEGKIDPAVHAYIVRAAVRDALQALKDNENAVGWYDEKVNQALAVLSLMHPEIAKDINARFAFTFALAVTSNGIQVNKNFQLAEKAYQHFKRTGKMPTDIGEGTSATQMNGAMARFNDLSATWGVNNLRKFMLTDFTVGELNRLGFKISGENVDQKVRGAAIIGAKIGNGFFSNLNGHFDALTIDRWFMRTWGRWTGNLFKDNANNVEANRVRTTNAINALLRSPEAAKAFGDLIGIDLSKMTPSTTPWTPAMTVPEDTSVDRIAQAVMKASEKPAIRAAMNPLGAQRVKVKKQDPATDGEELRLAGNIHGKNIDGQREAPGNGTERVLIRRAMGDVLAELHKRGFALTMADLQALVWYPEKRLYDKATTEKEVDEGYEDDEAPDYGNAAKLLARSNGIGDRRIDNALDRAARDRTGRGRPAPAGPGGLGRAAQTFTDAERQAFLERWSPPKEPKAPKKKPAAEPEPKELTPSYGIRERPEREGERLTLQNLYAEAHEQGIPLAEAVERARAEGRDIDVSDYFNLGRVDLPPAEKEALKNSIIDTVVETGRVPKERISFDDIRRDAQQLGGVDLVKELKGFGEAQPPYRAVRDAARHRINELSQQVYEERKAIENLPAAEQPERERAIAQKEQDIKQLLNVWMRMRSEDGRNLAMHGMMSDALGWDWTDTAYWLQRAKRELGLPHTVDLPDDVHQKVSEILGKGKAAQEAAARNVQDWLPIEPEKGGGVQTPTPPVQGPVVPPAEARGPMTRQPPVQGPVLPPRESRGPMTRGPQVQGPVLPPLPPRGGRMRGRMPSPQEQAVQRELAQYLTKLNRTSFLDTIVAVRNAGLLTGVKTRIRNIGGHAAFLALEELSRVPASLVDMAIAAKTGQRTVQGLSPRALGRSSYAAATKGIAEAGQVLKHGSAATPAEMLMYGAPRELNSGIPWLDAYVNYTRRSLTAPIRVMRSYAFQRSLEEQAALMARNSHGTQTAQDLLAKPTEAMLVRAHADAEFATFSNPNMASQAFQQAVATMRNKGDIGKLAAFVAHIVVPFSQTPSNILARLIDYTPVGAGVRAGHAVYRAYVPGGGGAQPPGGGKPPTSGTAAPEPSDEARRAAQQLADKALSAQQQRLFSMALGRGMVGAALLYLGWQLAKKHLATGIAPDEPGQKNVQQAAGQTPGAVKVGDTWRVVNTFSPVGSLITLGATAYERGASPEKEVVAAGKTIAETPMLSGAKDISEALQSPDKSLTRWMGSTAGSFVPTAVSDVGGLFDPYQRDARAQAALTAIKQGVQARVPGWRNQLPMRTDIFGQPVAAQKQAVWDPTLPQPDLSNDVTSELQAHDIGISTPQRAKPDLETDAEYRDRAARIGDAIRIRLERLVASPSYQSWSDDVQAKELEHAIRMGEDSVPRPTEKRARALAAAGR